MNHNDVELNAKELFLGFAMVLHSTAGNIENKKMSLFCIQIIEKILKINKKTN